MTLKIKRKLKFYLGMKTLAPQFLKTHFGSISIRQRIIFYNVIKDDLTDEQKTVLLHELYLNLNILEESNKNAEEFRYILVGNIIDKHYFGENKEIRSGSKNFRAGAKVYLLPEYGGNGHAEIPVYGLPKKSRRKVQIVIRRSMIKNLRVKKTFDPKLIAKVDDNFFYDNFDNRKDHLKWYADSINENNKTNGIEIADDSNLNNPIR